ncbi:GGDEF domain-containing protein [Actinotalea sp. BY-33]|uniref:GGDEF domain-containing protein n=1 Tax=Actinotalea soli TaxID=2819234 RepID=A0A939LQV3_9CELL|nr:bifunctional diguanylate cyclase/phosphodiesterase [Actinotalea soli]MBO1750439.1 GGDEF domain-containing protein [Actinotalea soli]
MSPLAPPTLTIIQCVVAGLIAGLCMLHLGWWRGELRRAGAAWTLVWTAALAVLCLASGLTGVVVPGTGTEALLLVRFCAFAAAVVLALPAIRALTDGPGVRGLVVGTLAWYGTAVVLWSTTDLVYTHTMADGVPAYGPIAPAVELLPVAVVGVYVAVAVRSQPMTMVGAVVTVAGFTSALMLLASSLQPTSPTTELLAGLWVLPLVGGLQLLATTRIAAVRREAIRHASRRDALARVANAAWYLRSPEAILERARDECRAVLEDPTIEGTLRPLARDRFVAEFGPADGHDQDEDARAFQRDLARVVSGAAERITLTDRLTHAAFTDSLSGLHNRPALDRRLVQALERANVERSRVSLLFCDVEGLRRVNHRRGRRGGDEVLVHTARHLQAVAGRLGYVARHGGDEFVVLVERSGSDVELRALAHRLRDGFSPPGSDVLGPHLAVGVATWQPGDLVDPDALLRDADLAMLEAKRSHAGVALYDAELREKVAAQLQLRRELEQGLGEQEIIGYFQPLSDAVTLEVTSLEVLARWRRRGTVLQPAEWLPFAEESGLIVEVGRQVFRAARAGMERFDLPVAVNVAARQLDEPDFVTHVEQSWGTDGWDRLTIEVTESALLYDAEHVRSSLEALAERGVRIAIDDFGTGYNSLSRLGELPLHVLKIDRTFVQEVRSPEGAAVLRAIISLAEAHGLDVVAEGVEHADELMALVEMGVRTVQGNMLGAARAGLPIRGARAESARTSPAAVHLAAVHRVRPASV